MKGDNNNRLDAIIKKGLLEKLQGGDISIEEYCTLSLLVDDSFSIHSDTIETYFGKTWNKPSKAMDIDIQNEIFQDITDTLAPNTAQNSVNQIGYSYSKQKLRFRLSLAASFVAGILCLLLADKLSIEKEPPKEWTVRVENGQKAEIDLPDGSTVFLNSASILKYKTNFGEKDRILELDGEGYFKVAKDDKKAFVVNSKGVEIKALGTTFNVKSYPNDDKIAVTLIEGKLGLKAESVLDTLFTQQRLEYSVKDKRCIISPMRANVNDMLWLSSELVFYGDTMEEISQTLSRMYNVEFIFKDEETKNIKFYGLIKNSSLDNVLDLLKTSSGVISSRLNDYQIEIIINQ